MRISDWSSDVCSSDLNGAGKTSIFNCLSAVYRPQEGTIRLAGDDLLGLRPDRTAQLGIGRTFQNLGLFVHLDVIDNLLLGRHHPMRSGFLAGALWFGTRSEERRVGKARVRTCRSRWSPYL